jgi:hypothetical protein
VYDVLGGRTRALAGVRGGRTKSSSVAVGKVSFFGEARMSWDMSMRSVRLASLLNSASNVDRNGLRDIGRLPELSRCWLAGEARAGEFSPGDTALRKGLLEERLMDRPGDGCRSVIRKDISALLFRHRANAP